MGVLPLKHYELHEVENKIKYSDSVKDYITQHNVKEFISINPNLSGKSSDDPENLVLKFNIQWTTKLSKVVNLKVAIAKILGLRSSALQLLDLKEGCVVATFSIPTNVAATFDDETFLRNEKKFEDLSIVWMKFRGHTYSFHISEG